MSRFANTLGRVRVAAPCEEDWDEMRGDARVRFCPRCSQNVYNLSALTRREAERLVVEKEGRLCVRFYQRKDGSILTRNCPVGLAKLKRRVSRVAGAAAAAAISFLAGVGIAPASKQAEAGAADVVAVPLTRDQAFTSPSCVVGDPAMTADKVMAVDGGYDRSEYVEVMGGTSSGPLGALIPLGLISGLFTLLTWPLFLIKGRDEGERREALRIWRNDWGRPGGSAALPREGSAVDPDQ